jgi:uncharacterized protein YehS (DUF1456 family)
MHMQKKPSLLTREQLRSKLQKEKDQGYPNFKKRIAEILESHYGVKFNQALQLTHLPEVEDKINNDIIWAQHMGAAFWAGEIYENFADKEMLIYN